MTGVAASVAILALVAGLGLGARGAGRRPAERAGLAALCLIAVPCLLGLAAVAGRGGSWPAAGVATLAAVVLTLAVRPRVRRALEVRDAPATAAPPESAAEAGQPAEDLRHAA